MSCPRCGGPEIELFTGRACKNECDLKPAKVAAPYPLLRRNVIIMEPTGLLVTGILQPYEIRLWRYSGSKVVQRPWREISKGVYEIEFQREDREFAEFIVTIKNPNIIVFDRL